MGLPSEQMQEALRQMAIPSEQLQETIRKMKLPSEQVREALQKAAQSYSWTEITQAAQLLTNRFGVRPEYASVFETVDAEADDPEASVPLGYWLGALPSQTQVALLLAVLLILDHVNRFIADVTGAEIPRAVLSATNLLFAIAAFLLLQLQEREPPND
jgi:hypothetical protein